MDWHQYQRQAPRAPKTRAFKGILNRICSTTCPCNKTSTEDTTKKITSDEKDTLTTEEIEISAQRKTTDRGLDCKDQ